MKKPLLSLCGVAVLTLVGIAASAGDAPTVPEPTPLCDTPCKLACDKELHECLDRCIVSSPDARCAEYCNNEYRECLSTCDCTP